MPAGLTKRVEMLEKVMGEPGDLVRRVDLLRTDVDLLRTDFLQFKDETRAEFSAIRREMRDGFAAVEARLDETRTEMRVLHEEVIARIALLGERLH